MPLHKLPLIMAFNVQENAIFIHKFLKISLPWEGEHTLSPLGCFAPSLRPPVAPLTNPGFTTVTGKAKQHKGSVYWSKNNLKRRE